MNKKLWGGKVKQLPLWARDRGWRQGRKRSWNEHKNSLCIGVSFCCFAFSLCIGFYLVLTWDSCKDYSKTMTAKVI